MLDILQTENMEITRLNNEKTISYTCIKCGGFKHRRYRKYIKMINPDICGDCLRRIKLEGNDGHADNYTGSKYFHGKLINKWARGAAERNYVWELTHEDLDNKFVEQNQTCVYSGLLMGRQYGKGRSASLDRIDPKIGYTKGNFQFVCAAINIMKYMMTENEFLEWIEIIYNYRFYGKAPQV